MVSAALFIAARRLAARLPSFGLVLVALAALLTVNPSTATAQSDTEAAQQLAERHAPTFRLKEQTGPCDSEGEPFEPTAVDIVLDNDDVLLRQAGAGDPVVVRGPGAADLAGRGEGFFLDFNGLALDPGCVYEQDHAAYTADQPSVVYAHVVQQDDVPDRVAVQYWTYWYYNDWNNTHESDWEFIQVLFDASSVEEALQEEPISVGFAQHEGGESADWDSDKLERDGDRPVVYPSAGSHASYFTPSVFLGRSASEGFGCDTTIGPSRTVVPDVVLLPPDPATADAEFAWLGFTGRWGERHSGPFNGPTGPITKDQWERPIDWHDELRDRSVSIPGGGENSDTVLDMFCGVVDAASTQYRASQVSPGRLLVILGGGVLLLRFAARRTTWSSVPPVPLRQRRSVGQILRGAATSVRSTRGALLLVGLTYLPAALLVAVIGAVSYAAAQVAVGVLTTVMYIFVVAVVSAYWHEAHDPDERPIADAIRLVRSRWLEIASTVVRSIVIVGVLSLSIVGVPWAIRQFVRYQFGLTVATAESLAGREALARSSELVAGRWWRTATAVLTIGTIAFLLNAGFQLILLIGLSGVSLWLYGAIAFLVTGLVIPIAATAPVLLYGDAAAAHAERERARVGDSAPDADPDRSVAATGGTV